MLRSSRWWLWLLCGIGVALVAFRMASLSSAFVWGDRANYPARPITEIVCLWLGGWLLYAGALRLGAALPPRVPSLIALLAIALVARASFFGTNPIQEDDAYRYLWDGQQVREGVDPYRWSPREVTSEDPGQDTGLDRLKAVLDRDEAARENFAKINNPKVPTIYPPLNMPMFALAQWATPWRMGGLRGIFLGLELLTIALIWFALRAAGANPMWAAVYAWCPLTIKEMANSPHHDALVVCMLSAFLLAAVAQRPKLAAATLALATAAKLYPAALLPVLLVWAWRRDRRAAVWVAAVFAGVLLACYAPFLHEHTFRGAGVFASSWNSNAGAFSIIEKLCTRIFGDTPMIAP
ncbi:MAG: glycosyltransferase 87 family protein, partial [Planctomycetes bacterium]|nr:glycosyltransferase 87 family protein [Planctomycetota bacterium]